MKNYSEMSDVEINARVSKKLYGELSRGHSMAIASGDVDYCNKPSDAWPIIDENNITIINDHPEIRYAVNNLNAYRNGDRGCIVKCHSNGLRAAMIVFLMMQESKS